MKKAKFRFLWIMLLVLLPFVSKGQTVEVVVGEDVEKGGVPFISSCKYSTVGSTYTADEVVYKGTITKIAHYMAQPETTKNMAFDVEVYMGYPLITNDAYRYYDPSTYTKVFSGSITLTHTIGWETINLTTPYYYDGTHDLTVIITKKYKNATGYNYYYCSPSVKAGRLDTDNSNTSSADVSHINFSSSGADTRPNVRFTFGTGNATRLNNTEDNRKGIVTSNPVNAAVNFSGNWKYDSSSRRVGSINRRDDSASGTTITISTPVKSVIEFDYGVSSESGCDKLQVWFDGRYEDKYKIITASGEVNETYEKVLEAGTHTISLLYSKDGSDSEGNDEAFISNLRLSPYSTEITSISMSSSSLNLIKGENSTLSVTYNPSYAENRSVTWTSDNTSVATVDQTGKVTAVASGTAVITATTPNGKTASCTVTVTYPITSISLSKTSVALKKGATQTLTVTYNPSTADNRSVTWTSNNTSVATVSNSGLITAVKTGAATITATTPNGKSATCTVSVSTPVTSITLNKTATSIVRGATETLTATVNPNDADNKAITWSSSNINVATVDQTGKITAVATGIATITVTANDGSGVKATCTVTVQKLSRNILDTETSFVNGSEILYDELTYTRSISSTQAGKYQALYIPMKVQYSDWADDLIIYRIAALYMFDNDGDGEFDESTLRISAINSGVLKPNHPYIFKTKSGAPQTYTIKSYDNVLYKSDINSIDCSTVDVKSTFTGVYQKTTISDVRYGMSGGNVVKLNIGGSIGAFRWTAVMEDREEQVLNPSSPVKIHIMTDDEATGLEDLVASDNNKTIEGYYTIDGKKISKPVDGVNIIRYSDGTSKKIYYKQY